MADTLSRRQSTTSAVPLFLTLVVASRCFQINGTISSTGTRSFYLVNQDTELAYAGVAVVNQSLARSRRYQ